MEQKNKITGNSPEYITKGGVLLFVNLEDENKERKRVYMRIGPEAEFFGFSDNPQIAMKASDKNNYPEMEE